MLTTILFFSEYFFNEIFEISLQKYEFFTGKNSIFAQKFL
jgi:hypothetical protein